MNFEVTQHDHLTEVFLFFFWLQVLRKAQFNCVHG